MSDNTATLIGATGLIGSHLLRLLISDGGYDKIRVIVRRPIPVDSPNAEVIQIDFADPDAYRNAISGSNAVFCAVGTTRKNVKGDKDAYRKVDYDIPVNAAKFCKETGVPKFLMVSSVGAESKSTAFYTSLKGEIEDAVREMNIQSVSVFRPSLLLGERNEFRVTEKIFQLIAPVFSFLMPSDYKPVHASDVAKAMLFAAEKSAPGFNIYFYNDIVSRDSSRHA